jgi:hypothetical protein
MSSMVSRMQTTRAIATATAAAVQAVEAQVVQIILYQK